MTVTAFFQRINPFVDVPEGSWYEDAVLWAFWNDITEGTGATTFSPMIPCTRAQMVTFLWRTAGKPEPSTAACPFTYEALLWAYEQGIALGTDADAFRPNRACLRAEIAAFLDRTYHEMIPHVKLDLRIEKSKKEKAK